MGPEDKRGHHLLRSAAVKIEDEVHVGEYLLYEPCLYPLSRGAVLVPGITCIEVVAVLRHQTVAVGAEAAVVHAVHEYDVSGELRGIDGLRRPDDCGHSVVLPVMDAGGNQHGLSLSRSADEGGGDLIGSVVIETFHFRGIFYAAHGYPQHRLELFAALETVAENCPFLHYHFLPFFKIKRSAASDGCADRISCNKNDITPRVRGIMIDTGTGKSSDSRIIASFPSSRISPVTLWETLPNYSGGSVRGSHPVPYYPFQRNETSAYLFSYQSHYITLMSFKSIAPIFFSQDGDYCVLGIETLL